MIALFTGDSPARPRTAFPQAHTQQPAYRVPKTEDAVSERLLTNKQASALLSGLPSQSKAARLKQRELLTSLAEPVPNEDTSE